MEMISTLAVRGYNAALGIAKPAPGAPSGQGFGLGDGAGAQGDLAGPGGLARAAQDFADTLRTGERTAQAAMTGGADPYSLVQALAQTELAVETAVSVRDRVVEAYQEILRMPV